MTDEGLLLYGGRKDFQIKFNGYRIELEDVAQNLLKSRYVELFFLCYDIINVARILVGSMVLANKLEKFSMD